MPTVPSVTSESVQLKCRDSERPSTDYIGQYGSEKKKSLIASCSLATAVQTAGLAHSNTAATLQY